MICPQCQHENSEDRLYCNICGVLLQQEAEEEPPESPASAYRTPSGNEPPPLPHGGFGHITDSTFSVFGAHYLPFILIALLPQIPLLAGGIMAQLGIGPAFTLFDAPMEQGVEPSEPLQISLWEMIGIILSFALSILAGGATIYAAARHFLGSPVLVQRSYEYAWARFPRLLGATLIVVLILIAPAVLSAFVIGIPILIFAIVVLLFVSHAVAIEQNGSTDAVRRSWNVVQGNWWRTFVLLMAIVLAAMGATLIIFLPASLFMRPILLALLSTAFSAFVTPIATIAITVLYFDIRVRKEQYTHNDLARELGELDTAGPHYEAGG